MARLVVGRAHQTGLCRASQRRQFPAGGIQRCRCSRSLSEVPWAHPAQDGRLWPGPLPAHHHRDRGGDARACEGDGRLRQWQGQGGRGQMSEPLFKQVALIGLGLIGSSLARVIKKERLADHVAGTARSAKTRVKAWELGYLDSIHDDSAACVKGADLVFICAPLGTYAEIGAAIRDHLAKGAILTDVGSAKQSVIRDLGPNVPDGVHLIPGHPVAGTEHSGPEAGFAELFQGRWCILTPPPGSDEAAVEKLATLWQRAGSHEIGRAACRERV